MAAIGGGIRPEPQVCAAQCVPIDRQRVAGTKTVGRLAPAAGVCEGEWRPIQTLFLSPVTADITLYRDLTDEGLSMVVDLLEHLRSLEH